MTKKNNQCDNTMYSNLNKLLEDICTFLMDEHKLSALSIQDRKIADSLVSRSKIQLQQISILSQDVFEKEPDIHLTLSKSLRDNTEDYSYNVSAADARKDSTCTKYGDIRWKTKIIYFNTTKKIFAAIYQQSMLIFYNDRESKPFDCINLLKYEAKCDKTDKEVMFHLMPDNPADKMHIFYAQTPKDMNQWVARINQCRARQTKEVPIILAPPKTIEQEEIADYDIPGPPESEDQQIMDDGDDIYEDITDPVFMAEELPIEPQKLPPDLPVKPSHLIAPRLPPQSQEYYEEDDFSESENEEPIYDTYVPEKLPVKPPTRPKPRF